MNCSIKTIEIQVPIWSSKSIGINISDCNPDDYINIDIIYENKQGIRLYPNTYQIKASEAYKYPQQKLKGAIVHIIPINNLKPINNMAKSAKGGFISSDALTKAKEDLKNFKKHMSGGAHELKLKSVELKTSKNGDDMIVIEFEKGPEFYTLMQYLTFSKAAMDIATKKAVEVLEKGYGAKMQACDTIDDLVAQLRQFINKPILWAVRSKSKLITNKKGETIVVNSPELWYCGAVATRESFKVDPTKISVAMSDEDMRKYNSIIELTGNPPRRMDNTEEDSNTEAIKETANVVSNSANNLDTGLPPAETEDDDLPF